MTTREDPARTGRVEFSPVRAGSAALEYDGDSSTLRLSGDLDDLATGALASALTHASRQSSPLRVDLTEVSYLPSLAVGALATAVVRAGDDDREVLLTAREGCIAQQVLRVTGIPHETGAAASRAQRTS